MKTAFGITTEQGFMKVIMSGNRVEIEDIPTDYLQFIAVEKFSVNAIRLSEWSEDIYAGSVSTFLDEKVYCPRRFVWSSKK